MSFRNGDKSRSGRLRKQKIQKRVKTRALKVSVAAGPQTETVVTKAAKKIGSAVAAVAVAAHIAEPKKKATKKAPKKEAAKKEE